MAWAPDYVSTAEAKAFLRVTDTVDDTEIGLIVTSVSRQIDQACHRQFGQVASPEVRTYTAVYDRHRATPRWVVDIDDLATTTGFSFTVGGTAVTDYTLEPRNAVLKGKVWTRLVFGDNPEVTPTGADDEIAATGSWGWAAVPSAVKVAGRLQTSRVLARRDSPYGVAGSPQDGSELRLLARLDPDVLTSLSPYVRWWGAV